MNCNEISCSYSSALLSAVLPVAQAQDGPLRIEITARLSPDPCPFAVPAFSPKAVTQGQMLVDLARVVSEDLVGSGSIPRKLPPAPYIFRR